MYPVAQKGKQVISPFKQFLKESTVHGIKYLAIPNRPIAERIFWILILLTSTGFACIFIYNVLQKYVQSPVIVSFQPSQTSISDVPFPSVTVCSANRFKKSAWENLVEKFRGQEKNSDPDLNITRTSIRQLDHFCSSGTSFGTRFNYSINETTTNICQRLGVSCENANDTEDKPMLASHVMTQDELRVLINAFPTCIDMIPLCLWEGEIKECHTIFFKLITDMGHCCTYNAMPRQLLLRNADEIKGMDPPLNKEGSEYWDNFDMDEVLQSDPGQNDQIDKNLNYLKLKFQSKAGQTSGLSILLKNDIDEYFCDNHNSYGYRIYTHSPIEYPHPGDFGMAVAPNTEVFMSIQADVTKADRSVKWMNSDQRKCYYSKEYPLNSFSVYTQSNCVDQCLSKIIAKECDCVRLDMPLRFTDKILENVTFCETVKFVCARNVTYSSIKHGMEKLCPECLPSCNKIEYRAQISSLPLPPDFSIPVDEDDENSTMLMGKNLTIVHIYFGSDNVYSRMRKKLYGPNDLFAHIGGILGLFLGFSVISLIEPLNILFRILTNSVASTTENASGSKEPIKVANSFLRQPRVYGSVAIHPSVIGIGGLKSGESWQNKYAGYYSAFIPNTNYNSRVYPQN